MVSLHVRSLRPRFLSSIRKAGGQNYFHDLNVPTRNEIKGYLRAPGLKAKGKALSRRKVDFKANDLSTFGTYNDTR